MNHDERDTLPPTDAELESMAAFELVIREQGENDARLLRLQALIFDEIDR